MYICALHSYISDVVNIYPYIYKPFLTLVTSIHLLLMNLYIDIFKRSYINIYFSPLIKNIVQIVYTEIKIDTVIISNGRY